MDSFRRRTLLRRSIDRQKEMQWAIDSFQVASLEELIRGVPVGIGKTFKCPICVLSLIDEDYLKVESSTGLEAGKINIDKIPIGKSFSGRMVKRGEPQLFKDVSLYIETIPENMEPYFSGSMVVTPLVFNKQIIGLISICRPAPLSPFSIEDYDRLIAYANQLAFAIECQRLADKRSEELIKAHEVLSKLNAQLRNDIIRRKQVEEELRKSKYQYETLATNIPIGVYLVHTTPAGGLLFKYVSPQMAKMFGLPAESILADPQIAFQSIHHEEREDFVRLNHQVMETKQHFLWEGRAVVAETIKWLRIESQPELLENGDVLWHGIVADITGRMQAEEALRESEERFRLLVKNSSDITVLADPVGNLLYCSDSVEHITGYTPSEVVGKNGQEFIHPDDYKILQDAARQIMEKPDQSLRIEYRRKHKQGGWINLEAFCQNQMANPVIKSIVLNIRDITDRKQMESRLMQAQKLEAIGTLAGGMAHNFNNILMGIQGYAYMMLMRIKPDHPHYERLKSIEDQTKSGAELTKQILGFARGVQSETKPLDINKILSRSAALFCMAKKEVIMKTNLAEDVMTTLADQNQMEQVFLNLFMNASQAMPQGGNIYIETLSVSLKDSDIKPYNATPGTYTKITVTDTGIGMDDNTRERIFEPFFTTKRASGGTGLGLSTVYGIVKDHRGFITVDSEFGHGTTFTIYLPATKKEAAPVNTDTVKIMRGAETILVVDDEMAAREVGREFLEYLGYRVYMAGSGQEAIKVYAEKKNTIDMVVLDMIMPGISGGETFDRLREINPGVRVLVCSGYSMNSDVRQILDRGCKGFLQKPIQLAKLSQTVREVLNN